MEGKTVTGIPLESDGRITGKVIMVYTDALASGVDSYVSVTMLLVESEGFTFNMRPRDIIRVEKEQL